MPAYRERPRCRKVLLELMEKYKWSLEDLFTQKQMFLSEGLRRQARKMLQEQALSNSETTR